MRRWILTFLSLAILGTALTTAQAQSDAAAAYAKAKQYFADGKFDQAVESAKAASTTDPKNPEVFLLLGKSHYQLGHLDKALAAWKTTLRLAPKQPFASRMVTALRAEKATLDTRIRLITLLIEENLDQEASAEIGRLLGDTALGNTSRAKLLLFKAEISLKLGRMNETLATIGKARVLHGDNVNALKAALIEGQAKLLSDATTTEAITILEKLAIDHADTSDGASAQYVLFKFDLNKETPTAARADALMKWIKNNPNNPRVDEATHTLLNAYFSLAQQPPRPTSDAQLGQWDKKAIALAADLYKKNLSVKTASKLTERVLQHLDLRYGKQNATAAAIEGITLWQAGSLSSSDKVTVLQRLCSYKTGLAKERLDKLARTGQLPNTAAEGSLPEQLSEILALYDVARKEMPDLLWKEQAVLANLVQSYSAKVTPSTSASKTMRAPDVWAIAIAQPVIESKTAYSTLAVALVQKVLDNYEKRDPKALDTLVLPISRKLSGQWLPSKDAAWTEVTNRHIDRLVAAASRQFKENIRTGQGAKNAKRSALQQEILDTLGRLISHDVSLATGALDKTKKHTLTWTSHGYWSVAEELIADLGELLPEANRRQAELAVVDLWIQEVFKTNGRLSSEGMIVPRKLDPTLEKALVRLYLLQDGLERNASELSQIVRYRDTIVEHYKELKYYDVAEAALRVKDEKAVELADESAAFALALMKEEHAQRQMKRLLTEYGASKRVAMTDEFSAAIDAWKKFITARPTSPMAMQAVQRINGIGRLFEQHNAALVAAGIYDDLASFSQGIDMLSQTTPGLTSSAELATYAAALARTTHAAQALAKLTAKREADEPPPVEISREYADAIAAYRGFIKSYPNSPLIGEVVGQIMKIADSYAKIDSWLVAESIFSELLAAELNLRRPERLEFARGLCRLGPAMPDHARQILAVLTGRGVGRSGEDGDDEIGESMLAYSRQPSQVPPGRRPVTRPVPTEPSVNASAGDLFGAGNAPDVQINSQPLADPAEAQRDVVLLAAIRNQQAIRANQVAQMQESTSNAARFRVQNEQSRLSQDQQAAISITMLSEAELARQEKAISSAYDVFISIRKDYPNTATAEQARAEILLTVGHWRSLQQWERSAALAARLLKDNPTDRELSKIRLEIARDRLALGSMPLKGRATRQERLDKVFERFTAARTTLNSIITDFPDDQSLQHQAQWDIATSFLTQARVVGGFSGTLARGQFVRAAKELRAVAQKYPRHPKIGLIPSTLWSIGTELEGRGLYEEAILVWSELVLYDPMNSISQQAAMKIAQTYHSQLKRPLKAAEAYQELNFARGGNDLNLQNTIFQIGSQLMTQKRWVEGLHVLETFVDSFPRHARAGEALATVGRIHQTNEAWKDAIAAYRRVINEFSGGKFVQEAKWSIAQCTVNLSQWREAGTSYREFVKAYSKDSRVAEANRRIDVLKDLSRYQSLVDEKGQRKAFDAQFQIAVIVQTKLSNPVKAIIEYRKVVDRWPESHLADDALYAIGTTYLTLKETEKARKALLSVAVRYPASPLADDALFTIGKSYEQEASQLGTVTRGATEARNKDIAQRRAYQDFQSNVKQQQASRAGRIADLRSAGKGKSAELEEASKAGNYRQFNDANVFLFAQKAAQEVKQLTATQLADRQDKINAALRSAVDAYTKASKVAGADKADDSLLQVSMIYDTRLGDPDAAMQTWLEIVRQFSGTSVAEDASWRIAQHYERRSQWDKAIEAYSAFLRNYRGSAKAAAAQFAIAESYEQRNEWINAMDAYTNYITNFPSAPLATKAKEQINWIKTYRL